VFDASIDRYNVYKVETVSASFPVKDWSRSLVLSSTLV